MALHLVGSLPVGSINIAASSSVDLIGPLLAQFDTMLFGSFGLGSVGADLSLQLQASLSANLNIGLQFANPLLNIEMTLSALANIQAALSAAASISLPTLQISAQLSANASLAAVLGLKLGGIQALISAAMAIKLPAVDFLASLTSNLGVGPVVCASWGFTDPPDTLANTGAEIAAAFGSGYGGIGATEPVYGVLLVTASPSASVGISATLLVT
jgi:hypothetical protein